MKVCFLWDRLNENSNLSSNLILLVILVARSLWITDQETYEDWIAEVLNLSEFDESKYDDKKLRNNESLSYVIEKNMHKSILKSAV